MEGLIGILNNIEIITPPVKEIIPIKIENIAIISGEEEKPCAVAAGISKSDIIIKDPINFIAILMVNAIKKIKIKLIL